MRDIILKKTEKIIIDTANRCEQQQYKSKSELAKNSHEIRCKYINALANLLGKYNSLLTAKEIAELEERLKKLEEED